MIKYKRIVLKISGEALSDGSFGINAKSVEKLAVQIGEIAKTGVQLGVVVGGGNFWRGRTDNSMDRSVADYIGMLATVMNGLALSEGLKKLGTPCKVVSSIESNKVAELFRLENVERYLNENIVVIFVGGTGLPYFSTDSALALRACEVHADAVVFVKNIDGVYDSDPKINPDAVKYDELTFSQVLSENLQVMDMTAAAMCREHGMKAVVVGKDEKNGILRVLKGEKLGTVIK